MADTKVSDLTQTTGLADTDVVMVVASGQNKKITGLDLKNVMWQGYTPPSYGYVYTQAQPAATWAIFHDLDRYPAVTVVDTGGSTIIPDIRYDDEYNVTVTFGAPTSGKAFLN